MLQYISILEMQIRKVISENSHFTESRKQSLYSNFRRLEETNYEGYYANIVAWREVFDTYLYNENKCVIKAGPDLVKQLADPKNGFPLSLDCVIEYLVANQLYMPYSEFVNSFSNSRTKRLIHGLYTLSLKPRFKASDKNGLRSESYVCLAAVQAKAELLVELLGGATLTSQVHSVAECVELVNKYIHANSGCNLSSAFTRDMECSLIYGNYYNMFAYDAAAGIVKCVGIGKYRATSISETDRTIVSIKNQINLLNKREEKLTENADTMEQDARKFLLQGSKSRARVCLQKKSIHEKALLKVSAQLQQLELIIHSIDSSSDNSHTIAAIKSGSAVLQKLNSSQLDEADKIMDDLQDALADANDINTRLSELQLDVNDEHELDDELLIMEKEYTARSLSNKVEDGTDDGNKENLNLPDVPKSTPEKGTSENKSEENQILNA